MSVDPAMLSGTPCLSGRRIPVYAIAEVAWADGVAAARDMWSLTRAEVLVACWFAGSYATLHLWQQADDFTDRRYRDDPVSREWIDRWRPWAQDAGPALWRGHFDEITDPPGATAQH